MAHATVKLTGTYEGLSGDPDRGKVYIRATNDPILDSGDVVLSGLLEIHLDLAGHFEVDLPATDDVNLTPTNFGYKFWTRLDLNGNSPYTFFALPTASGPVVDISTLIPTDPSTFIPGVDYATQGELNAEIADRVAAVLNEATLRSNEDTALAAAIAALGGGGGGPTPNVYFPEDPAYGAVGDGTTDDTAALQACIDAAQADGGGLVFMLGRYGWSNDLLIKGGVTVVGAGGPQLRTVGGVTGGELGLKALNANARVRWGQQGDGSGSANDNPGPLMNLCIDGQGVGGANDCLLLADAVETSVFNLHVLNGVTDGINWGSSQNINIFNPVVGGFPNGAAYKFRQTATLLQPAGHIITYGGHLGDSKRCVYVTSFDSSFFLGPHDNAFYGSIFETGRLTAPIDAVAIHEDGDTLYNGCVFTIGAHATVVNENCVVKVDNPIRTLASTTVTMTDCSLGGGAGAGVHAQHGVRSVWASGRVFNQVNYAGRTSIAGLTYMHTNDTGDCFVTQVGQVVVITALTAKFFAINGGAIAGVLNHTSAPTRYENVSGTTAPIGVAHVDETVFNRWQITRDGVLQWLDGASAALRGTVTRATSNIMALGGIWQALNGWGRFYVSSFISSVGQTVTIDAAGSSHAVLSFTITAATITTLSIVNGYEGAELRIGIFGTGTNSITWPGTGAGGIVPRTTLPQPISGVFQFLDLVYISGKWWEVGRSG